MRRAEQPQTPFGDRRGRRRLGNGGPFLIAEQSVLHGILRASRYHFHIVDGLEVFDSIGLMLPNDEAARRRALELATNLEKTRFPHGHDKRNRICNPFASCGAAGKFRCYEPIGGSPKSFFGIVLAERHALRCLHRSRPLFGCAAENRAC